MKSLSRLVALLCGLVFTYSQVGINTTTPDPSSVLDVSSDSKGVLIPRVELTDNLEQLTTEANAVCLIVYNLGTPQLSQGFYYWDGSH